MPRHTYSVYGLRVASALPLPPLTTPTDDGPTDVTISIGAVGVPENASRDDDGFVVRDSRILLDVPGTATFEARGGQQIVVAPAPQADEEAVRLYLLGSLMGAILHQRGLLPIHASAVRLGKGAVAFCAASGGGKSTLAALLHRQGYSMLCDDVGAVELHGDGIRIHPGVPRVRLTAEALAALGDEAQPDRSDSPFKREVSLEPTSLPPGQSATLRRVYMLDYTEDTAVEIEPLEPWPAFLELRRHIYRPALVQSLTREAAFLQVAERLVSEVDVYRLARPRNLTRLGDVLRPLQAHWADLTPN